MSIHDKIRQHLANTTEDTAKRIAAAIGMKDYPTDVINALSELRTNAEVECEKKKGNGNEIWYWLTHVADAGKKVEPTTDKSSAVAKPLAKPAHDDDVSRLRERIADLKSNNRLLELTVDAWMNLAGEFECKSIPDLRVLIGSLESRVVTLQMSVGALREQLDSKPGDASFSVSSAAQFVVKTPSKPPRFTKKHSNAHAAAMSAARQHGFAEVFALVPVGKAIRGAEWRPK